MANDSEIETPEVTPVTRDHVMQLIKQKENIEEEIKALNDVLKSQNVGMFSL